MSNVRMQNFYCCGWSELHGVQTYGSRACGKLHNPQLFNRLVGVAESYRKGAVVFASAHTAKAKLVGSLRFAEAVEKAGLGTVVRMQPFVNPNTNRTIFPCMWIINRAALETYCQTNKIGRYGTYGY